MAPSTFTLRRPAPRAPAPALPRRTHSRPGPLARAALAALALGALPPAFAAAARDGLVAQDPPEGAPSYVIVGAAATPQYEGADESGAVPLLSLSTRFGDTTLDVVGPEARLGLWHRGPWSAGPLLGLALAREGEALDDPVVARLADVDASVEPGLFLGWAVPFGALEEGTLAADLSLRTDVGGGWEGARAGLGLDYSWAATPRWRLGVGAAASLVDGDWADSRFGVSDADAGASGLDAYRAAGGVASASVSLQSIYALSPAAGLFTRVEASRLAGDAADSPLVDERGDALQGFVGAGLFYRFGA